MKSMHSVFILALSMLAGAVVGAPSAGFALTNWTFRLDTAGCAQRDALTIRDVNFGIFNNSSTTGANVDCAVPAMSTTPAASGTTPFTTTTSISVFVWDGASGTGHHSEARACVRDVASFTFSCGTVSQTTDAFVGGFSTLTPGTGAWTAASGTTLYPYISVNLGPQASGTTQIFMGYRVDGAA